MAQDDYIPNAHSDFFSWQSILVTGAAANEVAWNIPHTKIVELQAKQAIYEPLYNTANTPATKTKAANVAHEEGRVEYEKFVRKFVKEFLINNSAITTQQKVNLGLNPGLNTTGSRPAIETVPTVKLKGLEGGLMKFECRVESDSSRPSRHKDSDGVEIRYAILEKENGPAPGEPGGPDIPLPENCPLNHFSTRASFKLPLGSNNVGKMLLVYGRWKNNTDPLKSGSYPNTPALALIS